MKLTKLLLATLGCALMITGCGENPKDINDIKTDGDVIDINDVVIDNDDEDEEPIVEKTCTEISFGSLGGSLTDLLVGSAIEPNYSYTCSYSHNRTFSGEYTVKSDDRTIAQVTHKAGTNSFVVKGITAGDAIIQAVSDDDEVILQFVVHVRNRVPLSKIPEKLYNIDVFNGMFYGYKLSFIEKEPLKGTLTGDDDFETTFVNFKLIDGVEERIGESIDFNTYKFRISVDTETSSTTRTYTDLYVSTTCDKIFMYYTNGIVDIFNVNGKTAYTGHW